MSKTVVLGMVASALLTSEACAEDVEVNDAESYLFGVYKGLEMASSASGMKLYCLPDGFDLTSGQVVAEFSRFLKVNPVMVELPSNVLVLMALKDTFPCQN